MTGDDRQGALLIKLPTLEQAELAELGGDASSVGLMPLLHGVDMSCSATVTIQVTSGPFLTK